MIANIMNGIDAALLGSPFSVFFFRDGSQYCAIFPDGFTNIQKNPAGFGINAIEALKDLLIKADEYATKKRVEKSSNN